MHVLLIPVFHSTIPYHYSIPLLTVYAMCPDWCMRCAQTGVCDVPRLVYAMCPDWCMRCAQTGVCDVPRLVYAMCPDWCMRCAQTGVCDVPRLVYAMCPGWCMRCAQCDVPRLVYVMCPGWCMRCAQCDVPRLVYAMCPGWCMQTVLPSHLRKWLGLLIVVCHRTKLTKLRYLLASYPGLPLLAPPLEKNKGEEGLVKLIT